MSRWRKGLRKQVGSPFLEPVDKGLTIGGAGKHGHVLKDIMGTVGYPNLHLGEMILPVVQLPFPEYRMFSDTFAKSADDSNLVLITVPDNEDWLLTNLHIRIQAGVGNLYNTDTGDAFSPALMFPFGTDVRCPPRTPVVVNLVSTPGSVQLNVAIDWVEY